MRSFAGSGRWVSAGMLFVTVGGLGSPTWAARRADDGDRPYWRTNLFKRVLTDQKFLVTRWWPHELEQPSFVTTLGFSVAMAIQSGSHADGGWDETLESGISGAAGPGAKNVSHVLTAMGNGPAAAAVLGIAYLSSRRARDDRFSEVTSLAAESMLDAGIWIEALKAVAARVRPDNPNASRFFQYGGSQSNSFPSGHAMGAFSVASVFAEYYRDTKWVPWVSYGAATLIGASRRVLGRHFPSDVVVGALLGASIGRGVVARSGKEVPLARGTIGPVFGPEGRGIGVGWSYSW